MSPALAHQPMSHNTALTHSRHCQDTSDQTKTVTSYQHTDKKPGPVQNQDQFSVTPPQESKPALFLLSQSHPSSLLAADTPPFLPNPLTPFNRSGGISKAAN